MRADYEFWQYNEFLLVTSFRMNIEDWRFIVEVSWREAYFKLNLSWWVLVTNHLNASWVKVSYSKWVEDCVLTKFEDLRRKLFLRLLKFKGFILDRVDEIFTRICRVARARGPEVVLTYSCQRSVDGLIIVLSRGADSFDFQMLPYCFVCLSLKETFRLLH